MARDLFHQAVWEALEVEGWTVMNDGYRLLTALLKDVLTVDLGAEKWRGVLSKPILCWVFIRPNTERFRAMRWPE